MEDWKDMLASLRDQQPAQETKEEVVVSSDAGSHLVSDKLKIIIDRKGRKGKTATIIEGFTLSDEQVAQIASDLKRCIGTGGSSRGGEILLQGEWKDKVISLLKAKGFKF